MEILILDSNLRAVVYLDNFESIIWTDRYFGCGDFEIYTKMTPDMWNNLQPDYYLYNFDSNHIMVIEDRSISFDTDNSARLLVKGRSVESILDRRIIWDETLLTGNLQNGIERLLNENAISPTIPARTIPDLVFQASTDPLITALTIDTQFFRENLLESIDKLCLVKNIGFKIVLNANEDGFIFSLYAGVDRSFTQVTNPYVVFSKQFDNLLSSEYSEQRSAYKNVAFVVGEGEDPFIDILNAATDGLLRREIYLDMSSVSSVIDGETLSEPEYIVHLNQKGLEKLAEVDIKTVVEGTVDITKTFQYQDDFFLGDIVQLVSDYEIQGRVRITEMISSQNLGGVETHPTFTVL